MGAPSLAYRSASAPEVDAANANNVDYLGIGSPDLRAWKAFYGKLFGWEIGHRKSPLITA